MTDGAPRDPRQWEQEPFCYLTTTGRVTGRPHEIEIWFALAVDDPSHLAMMAGGGMHSDWVRNLAKLPEATIRIGDTSYPATARIVSAARQSRLAAEHAARPAGAAAVGRAGSNAGAY